jgi:chromosome segregation ATPase
MANPRELAEQAFSLLQNALRESEARASDLDAQLKRKKAPKSKIEEQLDVLTHRLESVEAERMRWQREASNLEEIVEAERAKVTQLKKKLGIAESGPEKLTKKEINFWRAKAEEIDTETREYKNRLAALRNELLERDTAVDRHVSKDLEEAVAVTVELRAEIETLQRQIDTLQTAVGEEHTLRASLKAELHQAQAELAEQQRSVREAESTSERTRAMVSDREHRLVELSAELEQTRAEVAQTQQREHERRAAANELGEQVAALSRDLEAARRQEEQRRQQAHQMQAEREQLRAEHEEALRNVRMVVAERDRQLADRDRELNERSREAAERSLELAERNEQLTERAQELSDRKQQSAERERQLAERDKQLAERTEQLAAHTEQLAARDNQLASLTAQLEHARAAAQTSARELDQLRNHKHRIEAELSDVMTRADRAEAERNEVREQIAGLESELKEEKENADNFSELANDRREQITKLNEQVEEANERYEEAKWRLGKAQYFERLVIRRKGVIKALVAVLRAKMKANVALKAGLDGLRTHKAAAEVNQQKLLARIDGLKAELEEAEETIERHQGATIAKEELAASEARAKELETRLNTQAELIQSLEADLKTAKVMHKSGDEKGAEIGRLHKELEDKNKELETKNQVVRQLQADADEQQRKLAKLRGSESETMRLRAISEKDRGSIDALEREITQLREALTRQGNGAAGSHDNAGLEAKLKERDSAVTRLMGTVKEHEATIKKLNESAESWKRKYQFLSTDAPDAYKAAAEK